MAKVDIKLPPLGYTRPAGFLAPTDNSPGFACHIANASNDWRKAVEKHLERIPPVFRTILSANDVSIILPGRPTDIGYTSTKPDRDDYYLRSEVEMAAFYSPTYKAIVLPEYHMGQRTRKWIELYHPEQVIAHETGHALDDVLKIGNQPETIDAYTIDHAWFNYRTGFHATEAKRKYGYLLQSGKRGQEEALAEHASKVWTGSAIGHLDEYDWRCMHVYSAAYMEYIEKNYDHSEGLSAAFTRAAANAAEYAIVRKVMLKDNIGFGLVQRMACGFPEDRYDSMYSCDGREQHAFRDILRRQGQKAVEDAYMDYREEMKQHRKFRYG